MDARPPLIHSLGIVRALHALGGIPGVGRALDELRYRQLLRRERDGSPGADADGLPVPPPRLRYLVAGTPGARYFLESGREAAQTLAGFLAEAGYPLERRRSILDFGCGCGRILRRFTRAGPRLSGCDLNPKLVAWCRANLPGEAFETNEVEPPLPFADASFDLVYAFSVFTHLPEALQRPWLVELGRVLEPGGILLLSTHGEATAWRLTAPERQRFDRGELVVRAGRAAGTNRCVVYHPRERLEDDARACGYEPIAFAPARLVGHDLALFRRLQDPHGS